MRHITLLFPMVLTLAACGAQDSAPASSSASDGMREAVEAAAAKLPPGDAPLQPGQSVQGTIHADVGRGRQSFRSLSTKVADDIGAQMDAKLGTGEGRKALDDANRELDKLGTGKQVTANDVRDIVGSMAGKTFHESSVMNVDVISSLNVSLSGKASDGSKLDLGLSFDNATLSLTDAHLSYLPDQRSMFDSYKTAKNAPPQVTIKRFEKNADGSYAVSGSFVATAVPASNLSKKLAGTTLPRAEGQFEFDALPLKEMPKVGR